MGLFWLVKVQKKIGWGGISSFFTNFAHAFSKLKND